MSTDINIKKKLAILDEGASVTTDATSIDFVGSGVNSSTVGGNVTVTIPGGSGNTTFYMNQSVTQTPYKEFSSLATSAAEQVVPLTVAGGVTSVIAEFLTPAGVPGTTQIPGGLWQLFLHFNASTAGQNWIIRPTVYKRDLSGTETLLFTSDPEIVTGMSTVTTMYISDGVFPATTLLTTDRIVVKISVENTTGVSQTVNFKTEGTQHYSVALTTLNQVIPTGAVTSVTGTAPIASSGGTTPAISIAQATGSTDGYLSSSDWSVFDAKVPATRNITINGTTFDLSADRTWNVGTVTGSGTTNYLSKFTGTSSLGNSLIQDNGTGVGINTPANSVIGLNLDASTKQYGIILSSAQIGIDVSVVTTSSFGSGIQVAAMGGTSGNVGISSTAIDPSPVNIGGQFNALGGTSNYSLQLTDGTEGVGKVLTSMTADGKAQWATPTSASGVCGIANSSGVYTYYATLSAAITAATSGQTVDLLTNITETGSVTITTKAGVKINGNGYTYTLSVNDGTHAITQVGQPTEISNIKVVRTGRTANSSGVVFYTNTSVNAVLKCQNVVFENTYGGGVSLNRGIIYGLTVNSYGTCISTGYEEGYIYNCNLTSTNSIGYDNSYNNGEVSNCIVTASLTAIIAQGGTVYNSIGRSTSGTGIQANTRVVNSTGVSTSGTGVLTNNGNNCVGISTSGAGLSGVFRNSTGISTSGYGGSGTFETCTLISSSGNGLGSVSSTSMYNSYAESTSNVATTNANIYNSTVRCLWNNAGGNCTVTFGLGTKEILNSFLEVTNASAYCITGYVGSTWKFAGNTYKGATTAVNSTNITQGITNTSDNQGNILM